MQNLLKSIHLAVCILVITSSGVLAQSMFSPVAQVNNDVITAYELNQRKQFFRFIRQPGNINQQAMNTLIEDRLKMQAARTVGLSLNENGQRSAMEDFAARANMTLGEFTNVLAAEGIAQATLRDFVIPGATWREVIRTRFARQGQISESDIDRALSAAGPQGGLRVLLSEVVLFAPPFDYDPQQAEAQRISQITSISAFAAEARLRSVADSAENGGRLDWTNVNDLPPPLRPVISALRVGQVTQPLEVENAFILFQLRDIAETSSTARSIAAVEYASITVASDQAAALKSQIDVCDDFYGYAQRTGNQSLTIQSQTLANIPTALAASLATLDPFEMTDQTTGANQTTVTMLCARSYAQNTGQSREEVANALRNRRLSSLADGYLAELRTSADIVIE
ncbi:MAG: peptidylprolyl isomerase [Pseudomonadota bacterium]